MMLGYNKPSIMQGCNKPSTTVTSLVTALLQPSSDARLVTGLLEASTGLQQAWDAVMRPARVRASLVLASNKPVTSLARMRGCNKPVTSLVTALQGSGPVHGVHFIAHVHSNKPVTSLAWMRGLLQACWRLAQGLTRHELRQWALRACARALC